ncbi:unnamed protein product [Phytophthora fragariaefolia]|uniref:Unnamed protein product n=1 Tax=Phytophthora fragariaefolia TaxID=1490495 RepID=A0A9W6XJG7_9STRA|nr:unnamed protein product [Phytophthora fragariaefolia]
MYYHIRIPEYALASALNRVGDKNEDTASAAAKSGLFAALVEAGDVKVVKASSSVGFGGLCGVTPRTFASRLTRTLQDWK